MGPRDFTLAIYGKLLDAFQRSGHRFSTFSDHILEPKERAILLRHDVDDRKLHSLAFARMQHQRGIVGTYYFRCVPQSFDKEVMREIHDLGHEVGYHYEEMDLCSGDPVRAYELFRTNLEAFRSVVPITSICMHGSPRSPYDNKALWDRYDYKQHGIVGEPYFDLDFERMAYYTDTGRCWDGGSFSVRDRIPGSGKSEFHGTAEMIAAIVQGGFPALAMLNFHPQRWTDDHSLWIRDKYVQYAKNYAKYGLIRWRSITNGQIA